MEKVEGMCTVIASRCSMLDFLSIGFASLLLEPNTSVELRYISQRAVSSGDSDRWVKRSLGPGISRQERRERCVASEQNIHVMLRGGQKTADQQDKSGKNLSRLLVTFNVEKRTV